MTGSGPPESPGLARLPPLVCGARGRAAPTGPTGVFVRGSGTAPLTAVSCLNPGAEEVPEGRTRVHSAPLLTGRCVEVEASQAGAASSASAVPCSLHTACLVERDQMRFIWVSLINSSLARDRRCS